MIFLAIKSSKNGNSGPERHYNREERLSQLPESVQKYKKRKKGFFSSNRHLVIILADIIIISLLFLAFMIYTRMTHNTVKDSNYSFTLKGYVFEDTALITLSALNTGSETSDKEFNENTDPVSAEVIFTLDNHENTHHKIFDFLPEKPGGERNYRVSIPVKRDFSDSRLKVYAEIKYESSVVDLKYTLGREN